MGANVPESAGLYFSWGNTDGHPFGTDYNYSQEVYNTTPGAAIDTDLSLSEDAARTNLGTPWRMPTAGDFQELYDNCTSVWTTLNGVRGRLFTSNVNGNTLFLPAAGGYNETSLNLYGTAGRYWSSTWGDATRANSCTFNDTNVTTQRLADRRYGYSIRAVQDGTPKRSIVPPTPEDEPKDEETATVEEPKDSNER